MLAPHTLQDVSVDILDAVDTEPGAQHLVSVFGHRRLGHFQKLLKAGWFAVEAGLLQDRLIHLEGHRGHLPTYQIILVIDKQLIE